MHNAVDCEWNDWSFGNCSKSCGGGKRNKTRTEKVLADHGGNKCVGNDSTEENCNDQECLG